MPPTKNKTDWTDAHQKRYNAVYGFLTNSLHLKINKDDFVNTMNKRLLFKYIMETLNGKNQRKKVIYLLLLEN